ncbi:MAG: antibiotic biosynthesis monooxygenase family protein [Caldilineaceae bacterium]|jgi:heme-degrading monooxygenase HmoA
MSYVKAYSQMITAMLEPASWDEVYFSLLSAKSQLQSLPGWQGFEMWANKKSSGDIKLVVVTNWEHAEQLEVWMDNEASVGAILRAMNPPPLSMDMELYEEIL